MSGFTVVVTGTHEGMAAQFMQRTAAGWDVPCGIVADVTTFAEVDDFVWASGFERVGPFVDGSAPVQIRAEISR